MNTLETPDNVIQFTSIAQSRQDQKPGGFESKRLHVDLELLADQTFKINIEAPIGMTEEQVLQHIINCVGTVQTRKRDERWDEHVECEKHHRAELSWLRRKFLNLVRPLYDSDFKRVSC